MFVSTFLIIQLYINIAPVDKIRPITTGLIPLTKEVKYLFLMNFFRQIEINKMIINEGKTTPTQKASYAQSPSGNKEYIEAISDFVLEDKVKNNHGAIATPGGTGAIYTAIKTCLDDNDTIFLPLCLTLVI